MEILWRNRTWRIGFLWSLLSAFLWATVYVASRCLMGGKESKVDPVTLSFLRFAGGGVLLFTYCFFKERGSLFVLSRSDYAKVAFLSFFSLVGMSVFLFWGQKYTSAINASMIMSSSPVLTMLLGLLIGERINLLQLAGMVLSTLGCMMVIEVITPGGMNFTSSGWVGDALVLASSFSWALAAVLAKRILRPGNDLAVTAWSMLFAGATLLVIDLILWEQAEIPTDRTTWLLIVYLAVFPSALGFYAWNAALSRISLKLVNIMQYLTPIMTVAMAYFILQEPLNSCKIFGIAAVLAGIVLTARK